MAKQPAKGRSSAGKSGKAKPKPADSPELDTVEDAVEVTKANADEAVAAAESVAQEASDSVIVTDPQLSSEGEPASATDAEVVTTPEPKAPAPMPVAEPQPQSNGAFIPLVLGGAAAGLIGYGVAYLQYGEQQGVSDADIARIGALEEAVAAIPAPVEPVEPDLSSVEAGISETNEALAHLNATAASLDERIGVLERQPSGDGTLQETAIAAYQADIDALRAQIEAQQTELQAMAEAATSQLDATRAEAQAIEQSAIDAARDAVARASLARVQAALESGAPVGAILAELGDTMEGAVPEALTAVADGAPTIASLQDSFPDAARAALATARAEGADGEDSGGLGAFFRNQFEVRSVAPREGDGVDATLSRAEAALRAGRLSDALAEVATLPEVSRAAMSEWTAKAELRAAALDAADTLATSLNDN